MLGQRFAVERVGEERLGCQRAVARQAAAVVLLDGVLRRAELDFLLPLVGAEEHELAGVGLDAGLLEHGLDRHAGPAAVADEALQRPAIARAFEAGDQLGVAELAKIVERQRRGPVDQAAHLQPECRRIDLGMTVVLRGEELILWRERALDLP